MATVAPMPGNNDEGSMLPSREQRCQARISKWANSIRLHRFPLLRACIAEFCGTAILLIFGVGVLNQVELGDQGTHKHGTFISISLGWGLAVTLGVFFAGVNGSGNINPAITLAFAIVGKVRWVRVLPYTLAQLLGAFVGSLAVYGVYYEKINEFAKAHDNGKYLVTTTGNNFVTNPHASIHICFLDQVMGTALLAAGALSIVDANSWKLPDHLHALHLGLLVYALVGCFALNAGCALNPARDLGPRIMLSICGWGVKAFTEPNYFFWVPITGPYLGAALGAFLYEITIGIHVDGAGQARLARGKLELTDS